MSWRSGCGCGNWWNTPLSVCGPFEEPTVEDQGRCATRRVKLSCEAPTLPVAQCADEQYEVVFQPENESNPFAIIARLFDECCNAITDEDGDPITLVITQMSGAADGECAT